MCGHRGSFEFADLDTDDLGPDKDLGGGAQVRGRRPSWDEMVGWQRNWGSPIRRTSTDTAGRPTPAHSVRIPGVRRSQKSTRRHVSTTSTMGAVLHRSGGVD